MALGDICLRFTQQAWHLATSHFVLRSRRGTYGTGLALVARLSAVMQRPFCVAGVALGDICPRFTWQVWHLATSHFVLRGRRGTYGTGLALVARLGAVTPRHFCVAGVALGDICLLFTWQVWYLATSDFVLRGRRGTYGTKLAGGVLGCCDAAALLRGRRGTWRHLPSFHVAGVVLMGLGWLWWRAWAP